MPGWYGPLGGLFFVVGVVLLAVGFIGTNVRVRYLGMLGVGLALGMGFVDAILIS